MDAGKALIGGIFPPGRLLEIPFYQRAYVWDATQWSRFLDDMAYISRSKKPFFFGSIILKNESVDEDDGEFVTEKIIVTDGQQRLTTLMIFMKVLALKTNNTGAFDTIFCFEDGSPKLLHGKYDYENFLTVLNKNDLQPIPEGNNPSQIIRAFNYFAESLDPENYVWKIINQFSLFVHIDLLENEDEQQVFDTINTPGKSLSTAELLKNFLFKKKDVADYESDWVSVFEKDDDLLCYWQQDINVGRNKRSLIDLFFDAFFQIMVENKEYRVSTDDKIAYRRVDRLAISIKEFIGNYCNGDKSVFIRNMATYAESFAKAISPEYIHTSIPPTEGIERINVIIFGLQNTTIIPYVLYVEKNVECEEERNAIYGLLEAYIMRRIVCHATTKNYNRFFTSLISKQIITEDALREELLSNNNATDATTYVPTNDEIGKGFHESKLVNLQTQGILYMLESKIRPYMSAVKLRGFTGYSLEHLMPKKWRNHWSRLATEVEEAKRDSALLTLGNLAIIPGELNSSIKDASWDVKLAGKGYKPGLKSCAAGLYTMESVLEKTEWNEEYIYERADWLSEQAAKSWYIEGLPEHALQAEEEQFVELQSLAQDEAVNVYNVKAGEYCTVSIKGEKWYMGPAKHAQGYRTDKIVSSAGVPAFLLLKGSTVSENPTPSCKDFIIKMRQENQHLLSGNVLIQDVLFSSATMASMFVNYCSMNGNDCWRTKEGIKMGEVLNEIEI